jgi:ubiquinone biosynthesis protein
MAGSKGFYVPKVFTNLTTKKILVTEWINGIPFSDHKAILSSKLDKKLIAKNLIVNYFNQTYRDGYFHADMHHGNLFLMANGDIAVVDFGIMCEIDKKLRIAIAEILIAYLDRDYSRVAKIHIDAGIIPKDVNIHDLELTCQKIGERMVGESIKDISLVSLLTDLVEMTSKYKMSTRPELLLLQKTILLVEGVGVMLDHELNIWAIAQPWVKKWAIKNISFDAKIRDAVVDFVTAVKNIVKSNL